MNIISKSGNLAPYFRGATQVVANSVKSTSPVSAPVELAVPKTFDVVKNTLNQAIAAQTGIVGGKFHLFYQIFSSRLQFF